MKKYLLSYGRLSDDQLDVLRAEFEVTHFAGPVSLETPGLREALSTAHGMIGAGLVVTREMLDLAPNLEAVATISVGYDNYPVDELTRRGIMLCNTPDVLTETTADTAFLLVMATARRAVELACWVRRGEWQASLGPEHFGSDVHGKTLGLVGCGRIGTAIARRAALGFGMRVLYAKASPKPQLEAELDAQHCELDTLLARSDFVCVTVPLTAETEHLIGRRELALMRPSAILVNIARGRVVDEAALIEALEAGELRAAGLDVFDQEPLPATSPLLHLPNVVALPHIGSATHETRDAMAQRAVDNITLALRGERPISLVNDVAPALNRIGSQ